MDAGSVPFIRPWRESTTFSQLSGTGSVHNFEGMQEGWRASGGFEAAVEEFNVIDASLLALLSTYRRAVCKITCQGTNFQGRQGKWTGTGFLVGPNLLITNQHVINSEDVASTAEVDFEFERSPGELFQMASVLPGARRTLRLNPSRLFQTSPAQGGLDYAFIWIEDEAAQSYGRIPMSRGSFIARPFDPVFILHHPEGEFKKASVDDTEVLNVDGDLLLYAADTRSGSSGAPVIARNGKLVGLHHAFSADDRLLKNHKNRAKTLQDGRAYTVANEGIKFSAIAVHLESRLSRAGSDKAAINEILNHFEDSDSITGPFGARGRSVVEADIERSDPDLAIRAYTVTDQDVDIAIWNMQWLNAHADDAATLRQAATVFADITQDIWVLNGIARQTATALARELKALFNQDYEFAFAEDETHPAQPLTAIFYNGRTVEIEKRPWYREIEAIWRLQAKADLDLQTMIGPIFPSFPALFELRAPKGTPTFRCNLVPLFVGQLGNAITRRAVAARLMTAVVSKMVERASPNMDWLVVGDVGTPLRRTRHNAMGQAGFNPILALDRERGGFSYLRGKKSVVSQLFVPEGTQTVGDDGGMITQVPRAFQGRFANALTGDTPYGIRISLFDEKTSSDLAETDDFLQAAGFEAPVTASTSTALPPAVGVPQGSITPAPATIAASPVAAATTGTGSGDDLMARIAQEGAADADRLQAQLQSPLQPQPQPAPQRGQDAPSTSGDAQSGSAEDGDLFDPRGVWEWRGLHPEGFLRANERRLKSMVDEANAAMAALYGTDGVPLTLLDVQVLVSCEAATRGGAVNPKAAHKDGGRGLLPLPANLGFWLGDAAASPNAGQQSLGENVRLFVHYLAALKAKPVLATRYGQMYRDAFNQPGIGGHPARQARLLAGVVLGVFMPAQYRSATVPYKRLMDGYASEASLTDMLADSGFTPAAHVNLAERDAALHAAVSAF